MYRPDANIDRSLANGRYTIPTDTRDYNAPVTGQDPRPYPMSPITPEERRAAALAREILLPNDELTYPTDREVPWRAA